MRIVIQRVTSSAVSTQSVTIGHISKGLCVLVGFGEGDGQKEIDWCKNILLKTKFWPDDEDRPWKRTVVDNKFEILLVSQFTLYGKIYKKGRLDFHHALAPEPARQLYDSLVTSLITEIGDNYVQTGEFGAMMEVSIVNDGPVTLSFDSMIDD